MPLKVCISTHLAIKFIHITAKGAKIEVHKTHEIFFSVEKEYINLKKDGISFSIDSQVSNNNS